MALKLPSAMSARFRHGTLLANACKVCMHGTKAKLFWNSCSFILFSVNHRQQPHFFFCFTPFGRGYACLIDTLLSWQALGYNQEIGYNTFLYANEADCRNLLMWLVFLAHDSNSFPCSHITPSFSPQTFILAIPFY